MSERAMTPMEQEIAAAFEARKVRRRAYAIAAELLDSAIIGLDDATAVDLERIRAAMAAAGALVDDDEAADVEPLTTK